MSEMRISEDGCRRWYDEQNRLHREDGPAEEFPDGAVCWHLNGVRHRADGAAFQRPNGYQEFWVNGEQLTLEQFRAWRQEEDERVARRRREFEAEVDKTFHHGVDHPIKPLRKPDLVRKIPWPGPPK